MKRYSSLLLVLVALAFCAKMACNALGLSSLSAKTAVVTDLTESEESEESGEDEASEDNSLAGVEPLVLTVAQPPQNPFTVQVFSLLTLPHEIFSPPPQA